MTGGGDAYLLVEGISKVPKIPRPFRLESSSALGTVPPPMVEEPMRKTLALAATLAAMLSTTAQASPLKGYGDEGAAERARR